jgi:hypothetical protein
MNIQPHITHKCIPGHGKLTPAIWLDLQLWGRNSGGVAVPTYGREEIIIFEREREREREEAP